MTESEILVIGGGIAGASAAYHLALGGHNVVLLERGEIASEASGVNAGNIGAIGWGDSPNLQSHLTMGSLELFKSLQLDLSFDIEFRNSGCIQAIQTEQQYDFIRDRVLSLRSRGYSVELLTNRETRSIEPDFSPELPGCMYIPLRAQADPRIATMAFASAAVQHGVRILTHHEVTGITVLGDGTYQVAAAVEDFRADKVVLATGAWCGPLGEMLGIRIPIIPVRGQMWATGVLPPRVFHTLSASESPLQWHQELGSSSESPPELTHDGETRTTRHLYGRQTQAGEIIFGGDRQVSGYDLNIDAEGIEVNRGHAVEVMPFLKDIPISRTWAGTMPFSQDGPPIIGKIPQLDNLYIVSGMASSGFGRGPMAGKLLADYIHTGHRPQVLSESDPARCVTDVE